MDMVSSPKAVLQGGSLILNATYYITKLINAAVGRLLQLVGADVHAWRVLKPLHP